MRRHVFAIAALIVTAGLGSGMDLISAQGVNNGPRSGCRELPSWALLKSALTLARGQANGGLNLDMWGTVVDRDGVVCAVAFTGSDRQQQWPGSRVISAQKANTANAFSLPGLALSTANLFTAVQPGGSLFGLQESNPVATDIAYSGNPDLYGSVASMCLGADSRCTTHPARSSAESASAATRHARITTSPIGHATR